MDLETLPGTEDSPLASCEGNTLSIRQQNGKSSIGKFGGGVWIAFLGNPDLARKIAELINAHYPKRDSE